MSDRSFAWNCPKCGASNRTALEPDTAPSFRCARCRRTLGEHLEGTLFVGFPENPHPPSSRRRHTAD